MFNRITNKTRYVFSDDSSTTNKLDELSIMPSDENIKFSLKQLDLNTPTTTNPNILDNLSENLSTNLTLEDKFDLQDDPIYDLDDNIPIVKKQNINKKLPKLNIKLNNKTNSRYK
jgi:hypothetical protein